jgi:hypothetical protein
MSKEFCRSEERATMRLTQLLGALALASFSLCSHAALGGKAQAVAIDAQAPRAISLAASPAATGGNFVRHAIPLADGGTAVEFVDENGMVFAVSWASPTMPDMNALLGTYRGALERAQQARLGKVRSPRMLSASEGDWTIVSTGHLRAFRGYSYLRSQLPQGFDIKQLAP